MTDDKPSDGQKTELPPDAAEFLRRAAFMEHCHHCLRSKSKSGGSGASREVEAACRRGQTARM